MKTFLNTADYLPEQTTGLMTLFDDICGDKYSEIPVSDAVPLKLFKTDKAVRCKAIDDAMDRMYPIFKSAAFNKSERMDFSTIMFPNTTDSTYVGYYNLSDLILTSWIHSNTSITNVCSITDQMRGFLNRKTGERREYNVSTHQTMTSTLMAYLESFIDRFISMNRSAYWEGSTFWQQFFNALRARMPTFGRSNSTNVSANSTNFPANTVNNPTSLMVNSTV